MKFVCGFHAFFDDNKFKDTFPLSRFSLTKSAAKVSKEDSRRPPSEPLAACTSLSCEPCVASACGKETTRKSAVLPLSTIFAIPRVRTYRTKKLSRFVHALSARPLKKRCGRESNMYADGIEHIFFAFSVGYAWTLSCRGRRLDDPHDTTDSKSSSATRIRCCAVLGYSEPRGRCLGAIIGKPVR